MSGEAVATMLVGMLAIWGGLAASIALIVRRSRRRRRADPRAGH